MSRQARNRSEVPAGRSQTPGGPRWHSLARLTLVFCTWKACLLLTAMTSPGPGYDTSTTLMSLNIREDRNHAILSKLVQSHVRWDSIYFTTMAQRGHLYEQEWAFGIGISSTLSWLARSTLRMSSCFHS